MASRPAAAVGARPPADTAVTRTQRGWRAWVPGHHEGTHHAMWRPFTRQQATPCLVVSGTGRRLARWPTPCRASPTSSSSSDATLEKGAPVSRSSSGQEACIAYRITQSRGRSSTVRFVGEHPGRDELESGEDLGPTRLPRFSIPSLQSLYLPEKYPDSVTPDYLPYQLWTVPTHIVGAVSDSLATSTLLRALGFSAGPVAGSSASAAIKWITKDGIGALGRVLVGGRLGIELDDDPRRWRMLAEFITSLGLALEISTSALPSYFLVLASSGNFAKAVAKGIGVPVFRVVLTHFAAAQNVGAVAAKEEVWEVTAQLIGYAMSIATLRALDGADSWHSLVALWACLQVTHVLLRYKALSSLRFPNMSFKRSCCLAQHSVRGLPLPGVDDANRMESMFTTTFAGSPPMRLGCTLEDAWGVEQHNGTELEGLGDILQLYRQEGYVLRWREGGAYVVLKETHSKMALLQAIWQAAWLRHADDAGSNSHGAWRQASVGTSTSERHGGLVDSNANGRSNGRIASHGVEFSLLAASLEAAKSNFSDFRDAAVKLGWDFENVAIKTEPYRISINEIP